MIIGSENMDSKFAEAYEKIETIIRKLKLTYIEVIALLYILCQNYYHTLQFETLKELQDKKLREAVGIA